MNRNWIVRVFTLMLVAAVLVLPSTAFASPIWVEKGDLITFQKSAPNDLNNVVKTQWQQDFRAKNEDEPNPKPGRSKSTPTTNISSSQT